MHGFWHFLVWLGVLRLVACRSCVTEYDIYQKLIQHVFKDNTLFDWEILRCGTLVNAPLAFAYALLEYANVNGLDAKSLAEYYGVDNASAPARPASPEFMFRQLWDMNSSISNLLARYINALSILAHLQFIEMIEYSPKGSAETFEQRCLVTGMTGSLSKRAILELNVLLNIHQSTRAVSDGFGFGESLGRKSNDSTVYDNGLLMALIMKFLVNYESILRILNGAVYEMRPHQRFLILPIDLAPSAADQSFISCLEFFMITAPTSKLLTTSSVLVAGMYVRLAFKYGDMAKNDGLHVFVLYAGPIMTLLRSSMPKQLLSHVFACNLHLNFAMMLHPDAVYAIKSLLSVVLSITKDTKLIPQQRDVLNIVDRHSFLMFDQALAMVAAAQKPSFFKKNPISPLNFYVDLYLNVIERSLLHITDQFSRETLLLIAQELLKRNSSVVHLMLALPGMSALSFNPDSWTELPTFLSTFRNSSLVAEILNVLFGHSIFEEGTKKMGLPSRDTIERRKLTLIAFMKSIGDGIFSVHADHHRKEYFLYDFLWWFRHRFTRGIPLVAIFYLIKDVLRPHDDGHNDDAADAGDAHDGDGEGEASLLTRDHPTWDQRPPCSKSRALLSPLHQKYYIFKSHLDIVAELTMLSEKEELTLHCLTQALTVLNCDRLSRALVSIQSQFVAGHSLSNALCTVLINLY